MKTALALTAPLALLCTLLLGATDARAQANASTPTLQDDALHLTPAFGVRLGGYGFREPEGGSTSWTDCRMDGAGLFSTVDITRNIFAELALDFYQANAEVVDAGMDRMSLHTQVAAGIRMLPDFYVSPYLQFGGGAEWTRVTLTAQGAEDTLWLPTAFIGVGGELNLLDDLKFGANIRMLTMALPDHAAPQTTTQGLSTRPLPLAEHTGPIDLRFEAAGQAQFFIRYLL